MAGPLSATARAKSLANDFGPTRGPNAPDSFLVAMYDDNPEFDGVELDNVSCPGYARFTVDNDDFAAITEGMAVVVLAADLPVPTDAWTLPVAWLVLLNAADPTEQWDPVAIERVDVTEAGAFPTDIEIAVFYDDDATTP